MSGLNTTLTTSLSTLLLYGTTITTNGANLGNSSSSDWPYLPLQPKQGLILFIIALPGTIANIVAFLATLKLLKNQRTSNAANYLVLALTATDFYGIVFCTLPTLLCYLKKEWVGGMEMCNYQGVSTMFASLASGALATSMAVERLFAVWKPFTYRETTTVRKTVLTIVIIWSAALVIAVIPLSRSGNFVRNRTGTFCTINWFAKSTDNVVYAAFYVLLGISLLVVVVICNVKLAICLLKTSKKRMLLRGHSSQRKLMKENSEGGDKLKKPASIGVERQLAKTVALISLLFIICWAPFMIRIICNLTGLWVDAWADVQVSRLLLLNFVLDPFLYTLSRKQCRDIVKGWLCCCCSRGSKRSLLSRLFSMKRKRRGSSLSSGQTGSGSNLHTHTSSIPMSRVKAGSKSGTPAQSNENSIADVVIHSSGKEDSSAAKSDHAPNTGIENNQDCSRTAEISPGDMKSDEKLLQRHYSTSAMEAKAQRKEMTKSVPDLKEAGEENKNEEIQVDVAYMYDLAFQKQKIDQKENSSL